MILLQGIERFICLSFGSSHYVLLLLLNNSKKRCYDSHLRFIQILFKAGIIRFKFESDLLQNLRTSWRLGSKHYFPLFQQIEKTLTRS